MIAWSVRLRDPRPGDVVVTPATGAYGHAHGQQLQRRAAAAGHLLRGRRRARGRAARDTTRTWLPETFRVGLLGHGTVGSAFEALLAERADAIAAITGARPELSGVLTRSRGSFEEILEGSDLIVELMGGLDPARDYVLRAMQCRQARRVGQQAAALPRTARSCGRRRASTACSCASRAPSPASCRSSACSRSRWPPRASSACTGSSTARPTTSSPRWRATGQSYDEALGQAQALGYAEADPTDDVTGKDAAAKMAILARLAFSTPGAPRPGPLRGDRADHRRRHGLRAGARAGAEADRHGRAHRRRHQRPRAPGLPLRRRTRWPRSHGPFNAVTVESDAITEITLSGPGAGGPQTASAVLGDVISAMIPPATTPETTEALPIVDRRRLRLLPAPRGRRPARRARPGRRDPRHAGRVGEVGRAEGPGRQRAARDGPAPAARVALLRARCG